MEVASLKVLDVDSMQSGIDLAIKDIEAFYGKISAVQRSVRDFYGLDDALKGKGGDAIRSFYNECHQPFLIFLYQSLVDYKNTLTEMKNGIESYESNTKGYVSETYLENDVKSGLDKVETKTVELTASANAVLDSVKDLVPITKIDESEVVENVQRGKNKVNDVVEELHLLDEYETSQLKKTKEDLQTMRNYLSEIESKFQSGDLSIENYSVNAIKGIAAYKEMNDSIYNRKDENVEALNENSIKDMPLYAIEEFKNVRIKHLKSDGKKTINKAFQNLNEGKISRLEFYSILSKQEQKSISWKDEKGGYESVSVWRINLELNRLKIEQNYARKMGDRDAEQKAAEQEAQIRQEYQHISEFMIGKDAPPHSVPNKDLTLNDGSTFEYRIDAKGYLHYKADSAYTYYEETNKQTKLQRYQGIISKGVTTALLSRGVGNVFSKWPNSWSSSGAIGGGTGVGTELLTEYRIPGSYIAQVNEVKTIIYRTSKETGDVERLVIDSRNNEILNHSEWKEYK
ncbi:ribonuclease YeeF family protein [Virgibacillus halodenitrificans]|uniref:ribonuclease YeeF family protein n=1 Tax=Virgibacillus halodenitrificans TaxID=1482 RepID=UPI0023510CF4|nr:LXG domain-containing protein [Virgibacillus halodenitrificans]